MPHPTENESNNDKESKIEIEMREETELEKKFVLTCVFSRPWLEYAWNKSFDKGWDREGAEDWAYMMKEIE